MAGYAGSVDVGHFDEISMKSMQRVQPLAHPSQRACDTLHDSSSCKAQSRIELPSQKVLVRRERGFPWIRFDQTKSSMPPKMVPRKPTGPIPGLSTLSKPSSQSSVQSQPANAMTQLWDAYATSTPARLKLIDAFLVFVMFSGIACFAYCVLIADFPFNAFLGA